MRDLTLAIETAVGGGSIALLENRQVIDFWIGNREISRAEDLLSEISILFAKNSLNKSDIRNIAYSEGPGSHTGIRIGTATAKGLKNAWRCNCRAQTVLQSLTHKSTSLGKVQTAMQTAKNQIYRQVFDRNEKTIQKTVTLPEIVSKEKFFSEISEDLQTILLFHNQDIFDLLNVFDKFGEHLSRKIIRVRSDENIAALIGITGCGLS